MKKHSINLDILRGIAALSVVFYHLNLISGVFDKNYSIEIIRYRFPGHLCVLVFFILSGYVIGRNTEKLANKALIKDYTRKRLTRLVPIYFIAILFTISLTIGKYSIGTNLSNLFFLSVPLDNVIKENGPLWSLQYEIFYYFTYIIFSHFEIDLKKTMVATFALIGLLFLISLKFTVHPLIISVLIGFAFWIAGAMLAKKNVDNSWKISQSRILSIFLLPFCLQYFNPYGPIVKFSRIRMPDYSSYSEFQQTITYFDLYFFPLSVLLILSLTRAYSKYYKVLITGLFCCSGLIMIMIPFSYNWQYFVDKQYVIPAIILISSVFLWLYNGQFKEGLTRLMKSSARMSNISYAIYIVHLPLIYVFGGFQATSWLIFLMKLVSYMVVLFIISYFLEMKYQPFIKSVLYRSKVKKQPVLKS